MGVADRPSFTEDDAARLAREWGMDVAAASSLPGERDQAFRIDGDDGPVAVLKISNPDERVAHLDFEDAVMQRLADREGAASFVPRLLVRPDGGARGRMADAAGMPHMARMLSWVPGHPWAEHRPITAELLHELGRVLGTVDGALAGFDHSHAERDIDWDVCHAPAVIEEGLALVDRTEDFACYERHWHELRDDLVPQLDDLPRAVIYNDANDWNVMVSTGHAGPSRVSGLIDFGDCTRTVRAAEVGIAMAYAMMGRRDPVGSAASLLRGYLAAHPLAESEVDAVFDIARLRLLMTLANAARQRALAPDNAYLSVSEKPARDVLHALGAWPGLHRTRLRASAGLEPVPSSAAVRAWMAGHPTSVLPAEVASAPSSLIDLSVGSTEFPEWPDPASAGPWSVLIENRLARAGARLGIGRYDEPRTCYADDHYTVEADEFPERRTVHLGIDFFCEPFTDVLAPWDGVVESAVVNDIPLDYGPTVILRHEPEDGPVFWTLFGHLERDSIAALSPGHQVGAGEVIARVGVPPENGGWAPHLHYQVMTDLLGGPAGNFPGACAPSERATWLSVCPDPGPGIELSADARAPRADSADSMMRHRRERLGPSLSVSYEMPLHIVRGRGAWLYDADGQAYLDVVNNVCHVGHAHPRVVEAAARQMAVLNTNTRYLHASILSYAERLAATFPDPLSVVYLVCSGSEANELALRMARTVTGSRDVIALDGAYHGNTQGLVDISPYKHDGPGGQGAPEHARIAAMPDPYRGPHRGDDAGARYADSVRERIDELAREGRAPAAFIAESLLGCGGQLPLPDGYLREAYAAIRAVGGVTIADEVQVGFGRVGRAFWGFELQSVVPDIVTLGKPIGNGHPLAAVVTTPAIASAFDNGMEYFNTFGGNPVSCAVGHAVLDVIEDEGLQENARVVGARLMEGLRELADRFPLIGDVRGEGLFSGLQLVADPGSRAPAPAAASWLVERCRARGVLLSTDGPHHDVVKMKPPLVFSESDADRVASEIGTVLGEHALISRPGESP